MADLYIQNEGSIFLVRATSEVGQDWLDEHISQEAQTFGGAIVVEHRFIVDILRGATGDGLEVE